MASKEVKSNKMKRLESKKSHSWWWDSHISPKNSKWLQENLQEMDQLVKRMLTVIEEDADSFTKKVELYFKKRPELTDLVEEFYRMYRSLAERYDIVSGELRKAMPANLVSPGSGVSDVGSEPSVHSPNRKKSHGESGSRAAGFDVFLGSGGSGSDLNNKRDESSSSESQTDASSVDNDNISPSNDEEQELQRKNVELEAELREIKEKLRKLQEEIDESHKKSRDENAEFSSKIEAYEEELRVAKEKIQQSEEEVIRLTNELQKYQSSEDSDNLVTDHKDLDSSSVQRIQMLEEELRIAQERLRDSGEEIENLRRELRSKDSLIQDLQNQLESAQTEAFNLKDELEKEKQGVLRLQDQVSKFRTTLSDREQEIRGLEESLSNANKSLSEEKEQLQAQISRMTTERSQLEDNMKEVISRCQSLEDELRRANAGKEELEGRFRVQIDQLNADIVERNNRLEEVSKTHESWKLKRESLISKKDDQIDEMSRHLHQLHMEHVKLIAGSEEARKVAEELRSRVKDVERELERKHEIILEGAEEKREVIRQLCFSLEHYRDGYHRLLRRVVISHKRLPVMAS